MGFRPKGSRGSSATKLRYSITLCLLMCVLSQGMTGESPGGSIMMDKMRRQSGVKFRNSGNDSSPLNATGDVPVKSSKINVTSSHSSVSVYPKVRSEPIHRQGREISSSSDPSPGSTLFTGTVTTTTSSGNPVEINGGPEEKLKRALLNHSLQIQDMDRDLDHLVFSQLPEGSKLILRSVKIVRTDGEGNEEDSGDETTAWNLVLNNETDPDRDSTAGMGVTEMREPADLIGASTHSRAHYDSDGSTLRDKQKENKYYHNKDHGHHKKKTITDTDESKVKNYEGSEKGLTDYGNSHGNSQSNEGERYKDSKKKNKGRKVTGFKRVYHKEEFQRTEHFYDDEEAKRIAESFGQRDEKEKSSHGVKDDDRKYHHNGMKFVFTAAQGVHREHTDGHKVKDEHGTKNGYEKGHHQSHKDSESHKNFQKYGKHQRSQLGQHGRPHRHENHNYQGAYSHADSKFAAGPPTITTTTTTTTTTSAPEQFIPAVQSPSAPSSVSIDTDDSIPQNHRRKVPKRRFKPSNQDEYSRPQKPNFAMTAPMPQLSAPPEMKLFFSPRQRHYPYSQDDKTMAYAPNFAPSKSTLEAAAVPPVSFGYSFRTIHPMKPGKSFQHKERNETKTRAIPVSKIPSYSVKNLSNVGRDKYIDPSPGYYSTLTNTLPRPNKNYPYPPHGNLISIEKVKGLELASTSHANSIPHSTEYYPGPGPMMYNKPIPNYPPPNFPVHHNINNNNNNNYPNRSPPINWVPLGPSNSFSPPLAPSNAIPSTYPGKYPFTPLRVGKTLIPNMFVHHPSTRSPMVANYRPRPTGPSQGPYKPSSPIQSSSSVSYSKRTPQFSQFMNGLMDSVAGFFGRLG